MVLFFSGMSSAVISSTVLFFLTWYTAWQHETKTQRKSSIQQLVHSSTASAFQSCPSDPMLVVDIKRTVDMSPLKRIRLRSHAASELKANRSMRARER